MLKWMDLIALLYFPNTAGKKKLKYFSQVKKYLVPFDLILAERACSNGWTAAMDPVWPCDAACSHISVFGSLESLLIDIQIIVLFS